MQWIKTHVRFTVTVSSVILNLIRKTTPPSTGFDKLKSGTTAAFIEIVAVLPVASLGVAMILYVSEVKSPLASSFVKLIKLWISSVVARIVASK